MDTARTSKLKTATRGLGKELGRAGVWAWAGRDHARMVAITSIGAALAWEVASLAGFDNPVLAPVSAVVMVAGNVHASFKRGLGNLAASLTGMLLAWGTLSMLGLGLVSIMVMVTVALSAGKLLGVDGPGVSAAGLGVLTVGSGITDMVVGDRILTALVGALVGVAASMFAHRLGPIEVAQESLDQVMTEMGGLLEEMSAGVAEPAGRTDDAQTEWLERARTLSGSLAQADEAVDGALAYARWGRTANWEQAGSLDRQRRALSASAGQVRGVARAVWDASDDSLARVAPELTRVLESGAAALSGEEDPGIEEAKRDMIDELRRVDDTDVWLLGGSVLADMDRMVGHLGENPDVLDVGHTPSAHALERFRR